MRISDWSSDVCSSDLPSVAWLRCRALPDLSAHCVTGSAPVTVALSLASYHAARPLRLVGKKAMSVPVDARCQGRRAGAGGTPARRPSAILRVELRGGEIQTLDRFRVANHAAHRLDGIEKTGRA